MALTLVHTAELAADLEVTDSIPVRLNIVGPPKQPPIDQRSTSEVNRNGNNRVYILGILTALVLVGFVGCSSLPDCSPMVKYSESKLDIKGFELPVKPGIDVKIGEMVLEPQVVQKATDITQILDNHRISMCNQLKAARGASKETHEKSLLRFQEAEVKLTQLAVLVAGNNPKAVEKWVESYEHEGKDLDAVSQLRSLDSLIADVSDIRERISHGVSPHLSSVSSLKFYQEDLRVKSVICFFWAGTATLLNLHGIWSKRYAKEGGR